MTKLIRDSTASRLVVCKVCYGDDCVALRVFDYDDGNSTLRLSCLECGNFKQVVYPTEILTIALTLTLAGQAEPVMKMLEEQIAKEER